MELDPRVLPKMEVMCPLNETELCNSTCDRIAVSLPMVYLC